MSVQIALKDTRSYTREITLLLVGGATAGAVAQILEWIASASVPALAALSFGAVIGLGANLTDSNEETPMLRLVLAVLGGVAWSGLTLWSAPLAGAAIGGALIGLGLSYGESETQLEGVWNSLMYAVALGLGAFTTSALVTVSGPVGLVLSTTIWGVFLSFSAGLKRLSFTRDSMLTEFSEADQRLDGTQRETLRNGRTLYERIVEEVERVEDPRTVERARSIARETSQALITLALRAQELSKAAEVTSRRGLERRIVELDQRIAESRDAAVREQLSATLDELVEQVRVRERLDVAHARIEAREERCFTALERLHVALLQGGQGTAEMALLDDSMENLENLSDELRWRNLTVADLVDDIEVEDESSDRLLERIRQEHRGAAESPVRERQKDVEMPTVLDTQTTLDDLESSSKDDESSSRKHSGTDGSVDATEEPIEVESKRSR